MAFSETFFDLEDLHPIDIVQDMAATQEWEFDRIGEDQIRFPWLLRANGEHTL